MKTTHARTCGRATALLASAFPFARRRLFAALLGGLPAAGAVLAQSPPLDAASAEVDPIERSLGVVVVTGTAPSSLPAHIPTTTESITGAQVQARVNATDAEDALKYFPSLLVRKRYIGDYDHAVLSTRASGTGNSARSLVYADGILLSNLLGNGAFFTPRWGLVTPEEIERVDVLYGPFSAAYPGNSAGAVVDFVTRMPTQFEAHAKAAAFTQPFQLYDTDASYTGTQASASLGSQAGDWQWFVNVNRLDSEGQPLAFATRTVASGTPGAAGTPVTGAVPAKNRSNQDWYLLGTSSQARTQQDHVKGKMAWQITPALRAAYTLGYWQNDARRSTDSYLRDAAGNAVFGGTVNINGRSFALTGADYPQTREDFAHWIHGLSVKSTTQGVFDWEIAASRYDYAKDLVRAPSGTPTAANAGGPGRITDQDGTGWTTLAAKSIWRPQGKGGAHVVEAGLQQDSYSLRTLVSNTSNWISGTAGSRISAFNGDAELASLWAQDSWRFAERWKTVLGGRFERWRAFNGETANAAATVFQPARSETFFSPKAALGLQVDDDWTARASAGRAVRMPTVSELFQGGVSPQGTLINNDPCLKPEQSWTFELSAERVLATGSARATVFHEATEDALYSQTNVLVTPNVTNVQNVDRVRTTGVELALQATDVLWRGVDLGASLTFADSRTVKNDKFPASVGKWQPRIPRWRATAVATWRPTAQWSLTAAARYSGRQYNTLDNSDPNGFAYQGTSKYFSADARARWQFARQWSAAFGIDNLNNAEYWNFHPYPQRTYVAELKFDL